MNRLALLIFLNIMNVCAFAQTRGNKNFRHGIHQTETTIKDIKDPENNRVEVVKNDKKGRMIEKIVFDSTLTQKERFTCQYEHNAKSICHFNSIDTLVNRFNWKYDYKHRVMQYEEINYKKHVVENTLTSYNKWGEKESEKFYKNSTLVKVKSFTYNEEGLLISQTSKDANGKILYVKTIQYNP